MDGSLRRRKDAVLIEGCVRDCNTWMGPRRPCSVGIPSEDHVTRPLNSEAAAEAAGPFRPYGEPRARQLMKPLTVMMTLPPVIGMLAATQVCGWLS